MYKKEYSVRWSDIDANLHLTSAAYVNYITDTRMNFFVDHSFGLSEMKSLGVGPVVLNEKNYFFKEIYPNDHITCALWLKAVKEDFSIIQVEQRIYNRNGVNNFLAFTTLAFIDIKTRKIAKPGKEIIKLLDYMAKTRDFKISNSEQFRDIEAGPLELSKV